MCAPKPPAAPVVPSVAEQTAGNIETARATSMINNPNMVNQYGKTTWTSGDTFDQTKYDKDTADWNTSVNDAKVANAEAEAYAAANQPRRRSGNKAQRFAKRFTSTLNPNSPNFAKPGTIFGRNNVAGKTSAGAAPDRKNYITKGRDTMTQTLSPEEQAIFAASQGNRLGVNKLAATGIERAKGIIGQEVDYSGAPAAPGSSDEVRNKVMDAMMSRSDAALGRANSQQDSDLIAAGIRPGTEAWDRVKGEQGRNRNDAFQQAELAGGNAAQQEFGMGTDARRNYISELLSKRSVPLNEITALMSGSQTSNPFAGGGSQGGAGVKPTDYFSGANMLNQYNQDIYNQGVGTRNSNVGAGAAIAAAYV